MIHEIWLAPPIAVARLGSSDKICGNFAWGQTDESPGGSGKTTLMALDSLELDTDGKPSVVAETGEVVFKDRDPDGKWRFRPVCPYFELHGSWTVDGTEHSGPITRDVLAALNIRCQTFRGTSVWRTLRRTNSP